MEEVTQDNEKELRIVLDSNEVENDFQIQNVEIKEEVVSDDEPTDLQPISQVYLPECQIKSEVGSSTLADQNDQDEGRTFFFTCSLCKKNKPRLWNFEQHLTGTHHLSKEQILEHVPVPNQLMPIEDKDAITKYPCYICKMNRVNNTFKRLIDLKMHLTKTHDLSTEEILKYIPFFKCKYCRRQFEAPSVMGKHEGFHTLPFKCDECDKRFGYKSGLKAHKLMHIEPQFSCPNCARTFRRTDRLNKHIKSQHRDIVSYYNCDHCEKLYLTQHGLKIHVKTVHSSGPKPKSKYSWKCDICKKRFKHKSELKIHIIEYHINVIKCLYCNKKFKSRHDYIRHVNKQHNKAASESNKIKPKNDSKTCIHPKEKVSRIQSNSAATDVPEIQPFSEVYLQEYHEGNIKTEPKSPSHSTVTDEVETTDEKDVGIKTEITTDKIDWSAVQTEESTEKSYSEGQSVNLVLDDTCQNDSSSWQ